MVATSPGAVVDLKANPSAEDRLTRAATRFVASGVLFYAVFLAPGILGEADMVPIWWTAIFTVALFGTAIALLVAASRGTLDTISRLITGFAIAYFVAEVTWLLTWTGETVSNLKTPWISSFPALASLAAAIVWRPWKVFAYLVALAVVSQLISYSARLDHGNNPLSLEILFAVMFFSIFTAACMAVVRTGKVLDETAAAARTQASSAAATEARAAERSRFDALIHDGVLATFLSGSRTANSDALSNQARVTLDQLDRLRSGAAVSANVDADALVARLRASIADVDDDARLVITRKASAESLSVPAEVGRALGAGIVEAVRNVNRHASTPGSVATCEVHVALASGSVRVDVIDNGVGFDPAAVPAHRLGLQVSIRARFDQLPGGWSSIDSAVGRGTRISIGWTQP